ncbi:hypothetical protein [Sorangium sp. So ce388]|uniref:hypothetical protein n=1 Tax=Sorangium sp. So ce388 TaxID=3133309 RepID=UPI003F5BFA7D
MFWLSFLREMGYPWTTVRRPVRLALLSLATLTLAWGVSGALVARGLTRRAAPPFAEPPPAGWKLRGPPKPVPAGRVRYRER